MQQIIRIDNESWQHQLRQIITDPEELLTLLNLDQQYLDDAIAASKLFPLKIPRGLLARIEPGNINDPILRQFLPLGQELTSPSSYTYDPVGEQTGQTQGMIQKYHGRALLVVNGHCAVNCRYCFRRHFPYEDNRLSKQQWENIVQTISDDNSISEVIYSGGDPLASSDKQLAWLTQSISAIPHIKRLRIHTRLPVVIPQRITTTAIEALLSNSLKTIMVLHINHANELKDPELHKAITLLKSSNITLLNQAVLLRGVNDSVEALSELSESLIELDILPYYLHVLDKVSGSAHFDTPELTAKQLHRKLTEHLPGYMVPKLVREETGQPSKTAI